ncbi:MAG: hypothetical protein QOJ66_2055, partial [Ilumatobacteraceae bacterium]
SGWKYEPQGVTAAQMSIGYGVARMLAEGSVEARHFTDAAVADPGVVALAQRITVNGDPAIDALGSDRRYITTVDITTTDGRSLNQRIEDRPGNTSNPMSRLQLDAKFASLAGAVVGPGRAAILSKFIDTVDTATSVDEFGSWMAVAAAESGLDLTA